MKVCNFSTALQNHPKRMAVVVISTVLSLGFALVIIGSLSLGGGAVGSSIALIAGGALFIGAGLCIPTVLFNYKDGLKRQFNASSAEPKSLESGGSATQDRPTTVDSSDDSDNPYLHMPAHRLVAEIRKDENDLLAMFFDDVLYVPESTSPNTMRDKPSQDLEMEQSPDFKGWYAERPSVNFRRENVYSEESLFEYAGDYLLNKKHRLYSPHRNAVLFEVHFKENPNWLVFFKKKDKVCYLLFRNEDKARRCFAVLQLDLQDHSLYTLKSSGFARPCCVKSHG